MGSLFAGPRSGPLAYTENSLTEGNTFYVASLWGKDRLILSTIVEVLDVDSFYELIYIEDREFNRKVLSIEEFLKVANNYIDLQGNPNPMICKPLISNAKWWRFWR